MVIKADWKIVLFVVVMWIAIMRFGYNWINNNTLGSEFPNNQTSDYFDEIKGNFTLACNLRSGSAFAQPGETVNCMPGFVSDEYENLTFPDGSYSMETPKISQGVPYSFSTPDTYSFFIEEIGLHTIDFTFGLQLITEDGKSINLNRPATKSLFFHSKTEEAIDQRRLSRLAQLIVLVGSFGLLPMAIEIFEKILYGITKVKIIFRILKITKQLIYIIGKIVGNSLSAVVSILLLSVFVAGALNIFLKMDTINSLGAIMIFMAVFKGLKIRL